MKYRNQVYNFGTDRHRKCKILIADICPKCGVSNNPSTDCRGYKNYSDGYAAYFVHHCNSCNSDHWSLQLIRTDDSEKEPVLWALWPNIGLREFGDLISNFSPRFVDMYHQAEASENEDHFELAGMGYRAAEEILIKDFALKFSGETHEQVAKLKLNDAIAHYFKHDEVEQVASDVVRINGNDYAHWNRPEGFDSRVQLDQLKSYLDIFISRVKVRLMIENPPVSRNHRPSNENK